MPEPPCSRRLVWRTGTPCGDRGLIAAVLLVVGIVVGSRGLKDFDPALVSYAGATVFSAFGLGYRYAMWLRRPPTRLYWFRGWQIFLISKTAAGNFARP